MGQRPLIDDLHGNDSLVDRAASLSSFVGQDGDWNLDSVSALLPPQKESSYMSPIRKYPIK